MDRSSFWTKFKFQHRAGMRLRERHSQVVRIGDRHYLNRHLQTLQIVRLLSMTVQIISKLPFHSSLR